MDWCRLGTRPSAGENFIHFFVVAIFAIFDVWNTHLYPLGSSLTLRGCHRPTWWESLAILLVTQQYSDLLYTYNSALGKTCTSPTSWPVANASCYTRIRCFVCVQRRHYVSLFPISDNVLHALILWWVFWKLRFHAKTCSVDESPSELATFEVRCCSYGQQSILISSSTEAGRSYCKSCWVAVEFHRRIRNTAAETPVKLQSHSRLDEIWENQLTFL